MKTTSTIDYSDKNGNMRKIFRQPNPLPFRVHFWDTKVNFPMNTAHKTMDEALDQMESMRYMKHISSIELIIVEAIWSERKE